MPAYPPPAPLRPSIEVHGNNCLTLVATGTGAPLDPYIIEGDLRLGSVIRCTAKGLDVRLSSDANNMLKLGNDGGLYGMLPHFADDSVQCNSGSCIDITVNGTGTDCNPIIVSGDLRIDPTCDLVHCGPNGLCVEPAKLEIVNGSCIKLDLTGNGSNLHPYQLSASPIINPTGSGLLSCGPNGLNVAPTVVIAKDTNTVDHLLVGSGTSYDPYELSSRVKLDPRISNLIHESSSGLYVECSEIAGCISLNVADTNTLDLVESGTGTLSNPWSIFGNVKIDPSGTNILTATPNGLLVNGATIANNLLLQVSDTSTVDHTITGTGAIASPWLITSSVKVDSTPGNLIEVTSGGLRVDCPSIAGCIDVNAVDTSTVNTTVTNPSSGTWDISSVVKISTTAGNVLTANATGLYVPEAASPSAGCWINVSSGGAISLEPNTHKSYAANADGPGLIGGYAWSIPVGTAPGAYDIPGVSSGAITIPATTCNREVEIWLGILQNRMLIVQPSPGQANEVGVGMRYRINGGAWNYSTEVRPNYISSGTPSGAFTNDYWGPLTEANIGSLCTIPGGSSWTLEFTPYVAIGSGSGSATTQPAFVSCILGPVALVRTFHD